MRRFFRTPKGLLLAILLALTAIAAPHEGLGRVLPALLSAVAVAGALDAVILRLRHPRWEFPGGAVLTALIIAMILSPFEPWYVAPAASVIAILSKYLIRTHTGNVLNPAAVGLIVSFYAFDSGQSWWGALPDVHPWAIIALFLTGIFIADRVNKMPAVLAFLGAYFLLFTVTAFVADPRTVAEIFRAPDLHAVLYFAFFMLTDPPTVPIRNKDQVTCGVLVAVVSYGLFEVTGVVYYLLAGLIAGNIWEAWRRVAYRRQHSRLPSGHRLPSVPARS